MNAPAVARLSSPSARALPTLRDDRVPALLQLLRARVRIVFRWFPFGGKGRMARRIAAAQRNV